MKPAVAAVTNTSDVAGRSSLVRMHPQRCRARPGSLSAQVYVVFGDISGTLPPWLRSGIDSNSLKFSRSVSFRVYNVPEYRVRVFHDRAGRSHARVDQRPFTQPTGVGPMCDAGRGNVASASAVYAGQARRVCATVRRQGPPRFPTPGGSSAIRPMRRQPFLRPTVVWRANGPEDRQPPGIFGGAHAWRPPRARSPVRAPPGWRGRASAAAHNPGPHTRRCRLSRVPLAASVTLAFQTFQSLPVSLSSEETHSNNRVQ